MFSAFSDTLLTLLPDIQISLTAFLIGGLNGINGAIMKFSKPVILSVILIFFFTSADLNLPELRDEAAGSLGLISRQRKETRFRVHPDNSRICDSHITADPTPEALTYHV